MAFGLRRREEEDCGEYKVGLARSFIYDDGRGLKRTPAIDDDISATRHHTDPAEFQGMYDEDDSLD